MRIAIPLAEGQLAMHFGHCEKFALIDVDLDKKEILGREDVVPPPHQPGLLPPWLAKRGANLIIAGRMGQSALELFHAQNIDVLIGVSVATPEALAKAFLNQTLSTGANVCDH